MDWVLDFYKKQNQWTKAYKGKPGYCEQEKIKRIWQKAGKPPLDILELGAGGGQFAVACAEAGYNVVAVEMVEELAESIKELGKKQKANNLEVINGDFFSINLERKFDVVCYWDGFGIGEDSEQRILLKRIFSWLKKGGMVFLDVYSPWFWARETGREKDFGNIIRRTDFDFRSCRFLDSFWPKTKREEKITQSLRCYTISDLELLLNGTGLDMVAIEDVAGFNSKTGEYSTQVDFRDSMMYGVTLRKI